MDKKESKEEKNKIELKCPHCPKIYAKTKYYDDHVLKCQEKQQKNN